MVYSSKSITYRLFLTEITRGVYVVEFTFDRENQEITILSVSFLDIPLILTQNNIIMPYDATFQAITIVSTSFSESTKIFTDKILITTGVYHTLEIDVAYSSGKTISSAVLTALYLRYSFYTVSNNIKIYNGLFVVQQVLPEEYIGT